MGLWSRFEEALLARTLEGRSLGQDVLDASGKAAFRRGALIDRSLLDEARERGLLEEVAAATHLDTSDTEVSDLLRMLKRHRQVPKGRPL
ncbi:MAG: hypothetical protein HY901_29390 [Deltaproteobacteria bacterium]|nr:hypothetical protein [Deltaproteobacteria bacterium]